MPPKRRRSDVINTNLNPSTELVSAPGKRTKKNRSGVSSSCSSGWAWTTGEIGDKQLPVKVADKRTYYNHVTFIPEDPGQIPMRITVEDLVATEVNREDEETRELKLKYWVGQVAALFEDQDGEKHFVFRFFDVEKQWRYMNSDDGRLLKAFGESFRRFEILETDVCETNPVEIIVKKLNWRCTEAEALIDNQGLVSWDIPNSFFSDRMIIRCGSDGKRRQDLSDSLWPAPANRRRQRLLVQCEESKHSLRASGRIEKVLVVNPKVLKKDPSEDAVYEEAVNALKLSVLPENLPCRESETATIREFIRTAVKSTGSSGNVLYISGVPGTGKTASVLSVVKQMKSERSTSDVSKFEFAYINSMKLNSPSDLYLDLLIKLDIHKKRFKADKPQEKLSEFFSSRSAKPVTVLLIDEIDYLVTKSQAVVYQLFDWPLLAESKLVLLTISNTMDLPERLMPRVASRLGLARLNYLPYSHEQIRKVILERLEDVKATQVFSDDSIKLVSRRVATSSGDIRKALHICRRAIELREGAVVQASDMNRAQFDLYSNPFVAVISHLPYLARIALISLVLECKFRNTDSVTARDLHGRFSNLVVTYSLPFQTRPVYFSDFVRTLNELKRLAIVAVSKQLASAPKNDVDPLYLEDEEGLQESKIAVKKGSGSRKLSSKVISKDNGAEEDENGSGYSISLNPLIENSDVRNALVDEAGDRVAQRLLN